MNLLENKFRILLHNIILHSKYRLWGKSVTPMIIYMLDGSMHHMGFADRIRQILGIYAICKSRGYKFGLIANYPYELSNYLIPRYDWNVPSKNISKNIFYARPIYLGYRSKKCYLNILKLKKRQLHVYASVHWGIIEELGFSIENLFWELFDLSPQLKIIIQDYRSRYYEWECIHFRFINLLGDFNEPQSVILNKEEKANLIKKCYDYVYMQSQNTSNYLLVCSDSVEFLKKICSIHRVFIIHGKPVHIDYTKQEDEGVYLKEFFGLFHDVRSEFYS